MDLGPHANILTHLNSDDGWRDDCRQSSCIGRVAPHDKAAKFGIVLLTPDDIGYSKNAGEKEAQPRARQNVVLEMGMLISAVGRKNVAILKKQHLEIPSDAQGILYISFNDHVKEVVPKLVDRLRAAGFDLNPEAITRASS